ncbi:MAG TPA: HAD-IIIC family phosphatase [Bryobacteraceae bacterium]|nr:HAD-IIIC family phosphatase [Bryobacteraceae bacterium]
MRLSEALRINSEPAGERERHAHLLCGFTPLHLETFAKACLRLRFPGEAIRLHTGLYGDLEGNIQRAAGQAGEGAIVVIEWSDLDQRLGLRASAGWSFRILEDILTQAAERCLRLEAHLAALARAMPVALVAPTLPLPPVTHLPPARTGVFELRLRAILLDFLRRVSEASAIRLVSAPSAGHDVKMDLETGFPYSLAHADELAQLSVRCLFPAPPKKGIITDLDQTLWKGILGDQGVDGISWSLEDRSQVHALYQQTLASLAESGVLVAIASKNDPELVEAAFKRPDILLKEDQVFPFEVSWGAKSEAISRVLKAWNIGADAVVFIDDSAMELGEVQEKFPGIECLRFPERDPAEVLALLRQLRERFGKDDIQEEDRLRLRSLRAAAIIEEERPAEVSLDFLSRLEAKITIEAAGPENTRAFELVNKTNQFNLNGKRFTEAEWKARFARPGNFLHAISYEDRFGPLGRIAVIGGYTEDARCVVDLWVMSCRAFSRHIEFQTLRRLFDRTGAGEIDFQFRPTERNKPTQSFFETFLPDPAKQNEIRLPLRTFEERCPPLFHEVTER